MSIHGWIFLIIFQHTLLFIKKKTKTDKDARELDLDLRPLEQQGVMKTTIPCHSSLKEGVWGSKIRQVKTALPNLPFLSSNDSLQLPGVI